MTTRASILLFAVLALLAAPASGGSLDDAKVALHLQARASKDICLPASQGGQAPDLTPCSNYAIAGMTGTPYNAYLVVAAPSSALEHPGVAGLSCGIQYDPTPSSGVDVLDWVTCADLEFTNAGPNGEWPASGGGNRLTFDYQLNCQLTTVPGYEHEGVVAVFGAFYVYAYGADDFAVIPNMNLQSGPELVVGDCSGAESELGLGAAGIVEFSADGSIFGCNPCLRDCLDDLDCSVPVQVDFGEVRIGETVDRSFVIQNVGNDVLEGYVPASCGVFQVTVGTGSYSLLPGQAHSVTVRFTGVSAGSNVCDLWVGGLCPTVRLSATTLPACTVSPTAIDLGYVVLGDFVSTMFTVTNNKATDLVFELDYTCPDFTVIGGTGPFVLSSGQSMDFFVRFEPTEAKTYSCTIDTGTECASVVVTAEAIPAEPHCDINPASLSFGYVRVGSYSQRSFEITNTGAGTLTGSVSANCAEFPIISGAGSFSLATGQTHVVQVRFVPADLGLSTCLVAISGACADVPVSGYGTDVPAGGQNDAVIALHATTHSTKGACFDAPTIPCSDYDVTFPVNQACDLWLVAARGNDPGLAGLSCGILYEDGALGAPTLNNGVGVDVLAWNFCASGLEFPNGPSGDPEDEWPASGGGIRLTWNSSVDCQTTAYGMDGIHAVAGSFYIYAYSDDAFAVTTNNNLLSGPELQVGDCTNAVYDLPYPQAAAVCGFGNEYGYNPCGAAVPVRLLSLTAARVAAGAEIRWAVADADESLLGFEVYRGRSVEDRVRVSDGILTGGESYVFVDDDPPAHAVSYWLAERSRAGETAWHGPAELAAASVVGPGLVLRHASPNPFLSATRIAFRTDADGPVLVRIFDTAGREVARPFTGSMPAGEHEVAWDGRDEAGRRLSAGVYLYRIESAQGGAAGKVVLIR